MSTRTTNSRTTAGPASGVHPDRPRPAATAAPVPAVTCCSCERAPATTILTWPDRRFAVCDGCTPQPLRTLAEPLEEPDGAIDPALLEEQSAFPDAGTRHGVKVASTSAPGWW